MRLAPLPFLFAAAVVLGSCTGNGVNTSQVYDPISGRTKLTATVTDTSQTPTSVTFSVDGNPLTGQVSSSGGQFSIDFDSTTVSNGVHFVKAVGDPGSVELLNASIFVNNSGTAPAAGGGAAPAAGGGAAPAAGGRAAPAAGG